MESMFMSSSCFTVFAGMVLPRAIGEHMRARACVGVRRIPFALGKFVATIFATNDSTFGRGHVEDKSRQMTHSRGHDTT